MCVCVCVMSVPLGEAELTSSREPASTGSKEGEGSQHRCQIRSAAKEEEGGDGERTGPVFHSHFSLRTEITFIDLLLVSDVR